MKDLKARHDINEFVFLHSGGGHQRLTLSSESSTARRQTGLNDRRAIAGVAYDYSLVFVGFCCLL